MKHEKVAERIIQLKNADEQVRNKLIREGRLGEGYDEEMKAVHHRNAEELSKLLDQIDYPTEEKVGREASDAAWLIIQHAIGDPAFMKRCLALLETAVATKKADPKQLAALSDRIAVLEGKHQLYGTQFDWDEQGQLSPNAYDDLKLVEQRRKKIGLNSLEEQTKTIRKRAEEEKLHPPKDFLKRKQEMDRWRLDVGWIQ